MAEYQSVFAKVQGFQYILIYRYFFEVRVNNCLNIHISNGRTLIVVCFVYTETIVGIGKYKTLKMIIGPEIRRSSPHVCK